jgi:hypothetical protein
MSDISRQSAIKLVAVSVALTLLIALPISVWANHQFNDVPTSNPFHADISAISDAGITTGFNDGGYHPAADVTRQAMAAFLHRGLGRVAFGKTSDWSAENIVVGPSATILASVALDSGAESAGGSGFVELTGVAHILSISPATCPCHVELSIWDTVSNTQLTVTKTDVPSLANEYASSFAAVSVTAAALLPANTVGRYALKATRFDASTAIQGNGSLMATYVPFGAGGTDVLAYCSPDEAEPNDTRAQAKAITHQPVSGCISSASDVDYYSINPPVNWALFLRTMGLGGINTCEMDTHMRLMTSTGTVLAEDTDAGDGKCSSILLLTHPAGPLYIEVTGESGATGSYQVWDSSTY